MELRYRAGAACAMAASFFLVSGAFVPASAGGADKKLSNVGTLTCLADGSEGFVYGTTRFVSCTLEPAVTGLAKQYFKGEIRKFGARRQGRSKTLVVWQVFARTAFENVNHLEGIYDNARSTSGVPGGAPSLSGGRHRSFVLQPLTTKTGASGNSAVDVIELELVRVQVKA